MTKTLTKKTHKNGLHQTRQDLPAKVRAQVVDILNESVAETFDLYSQVKQAHWNVKGQNFYQNHLLFDEIAGELLEYVDELAERVTALAGTAMGTVRMAANNSKLDEYPSDIQEGLDHIAAVADRLAAYARTTRENIERTDELGDADTADLYTGISRTVDKRLWFLEAHLQGDEG